MATQDRQVMVDRSDKTWSTGEGNGKPLQCSFLESPMSIMRRQKDMTLKDELPRLVDAQYATGRINQVGGASTTMRSRACRERGGGGRGVSWERDPEMGETD